MDSEKKSKKIGYFKAIQFVKKIITETFIEDKDSNLSIEYMTRVNGEIIVVRSRNLLTDNLWFRTKNFIVYYQNSRV